MKNVGIIHPWMPQYRKGFFEELSRILLENEISLDIFYGETPLEWAARNDSLTPDEMVRLPTKFFGVLGRNLSYKRLDSVKDRGKFDLLILEQAIRNLETYALLVPPKSFAKLGFWGHGRTYTAPKSRFEERLKEKLTLRADWFFGYTHGGVQTMVDKGFPSNRTTVVQNSIDTASLRRDLDDLSELDVAEFRKSLDLSENTFVYIGGIDEAKRIPFLLDAAHELHSRHESFRLVLVGDGSMSEVVRDSATKFPWIRYLGNQFGTQKALALKASKALLIPGRVGLIAVDSLASGTPIVTTDWPFHAPEFEYLEPGTTAVVSRDDLGAFCAAVSGLIDDPSVADRMSENCLSESKGFTTELMAARFATGIEKALMG
ncbi:glycosyltransferase family 4 protein [Rhodococcus sp. F64268]|uniref:glycosyltransferase family 4 protein n=1 Tax=Rhodococcus sp. F64268 TaxID=2926402 RepID=UPI001FF57AB8|nr:glycosyltransferase family 4 protein [Rhodococcus sp. F64268]MCK0090480.1 glycosyltransferase family 4 protein [Rhodococcus sp. F64268]